MSQTLTIPDSLAARLEHLAAEAGSTPEALLPFILEEGFEFNEAAIRKIKAAIAEADAGCEMIPHEEAMSRLKAVVQNHAAKKAA
jgi:predicted transcriptional regulator